MNDFKAPTFKSPPVIESQAKAVLVPSSLEKCNPLASSNNLNYIEQKLKEHRESIINQYGSSRVPTPCYSSLDRNKQTPPQQVAPLVQEFQVEPAMIDMDDELSQAVKAPVPFQAPVELDFCEPTSTDLLNEANPMAEMFEHHSPQATIDLEMFSQPRQQFESPLEPRSFQNYEQKPIYMPADHGKQITPEASKPKPNFDESDSRSYNSEDKSDDDGSYEDTYLPEKKKDSEDDEEGTFE